MHCKAPNCWLFTLAHTGFMVTITQVHTALLFTFSFSHPHSLPFTRHPCSGFIYSSVAYHLCTHTCTINKQPQWLLSVKQGARINNYQWEQECVTNCSRVFSEAQCCTGALGTGISGRRPCLRLGPEFLEIIVMCFVQHGLVRSIKCALLFKFAPEFFVSSLEQVDLWIMESGVICSVCITILIPHKTRPESQKC